MGTTATIIVHKKTRTVLAEINYHTGLVRKGLEKALYAMGKEVNDETKRLIRTGPKTGKKWPGLPNRSSAPHEAPADQSGKLAKSNDYKVRNWAEMTVGETVSYADYLEGGTKRMKGPRQHLLKAVNNMARNFQRAIDDHVKEVIL